MLFNRRACCQQPMQQNCCRQQPIMEPTITNCIEKGFYHEVPQE